MINIIVVQYFISCQKLHSDIIGKMVIMLLGIAETDKVVR